MPPMARPSTTGKSDLPNPDMTNAGSCAAQAGSGSHDREAQPRVHSHQAEHDQRRRIIADPEIEQHPEQEVCGDCDDHQHRRQSVGRTAARHQIEVRQQVHARREQQGECHDQLNDPHPRSRYERRAEQPPISSASTQPTSNAGSTFTPSRSEENELLQGMDGGVSPTSIVHGKNAIGNELAEFQPGGGRGERPDAQCIEKIDDCAQADRLEGRPGAARRPRP